MRWTTPTGIAEAAYQRNRARALDAIAARWPIGPAGLALPFPSSVFRKTIDGPLLRDLAAAAAAAFEREQLPPERVFAARDHLVADIERRFPPADMAVLRRYSAAFELQALAVHFEPYEASVWFELARPVIAPARAGHFAFRAIEPGDPEKPTDKLIVPAEARSYFERVSETRRILREEFKPIVNRPGQVHVRVGVAPRWSDIEAAWPRFSAWMAAQRSTG